MISYFVNFTKPPVASPEVPIYDDILDTSHYSTDRKTTEDFMKSQISSGSSGKGLYDFPSGKKISPSDIPSDIEIQIREGRLTASEIQTLQNSLEAEFMHTLSKRDKEKLEARKEAINKARQDFLDNQTGFEPPKEE